MPSQGRGARGTQTPVPADLQMTACSPPSFTCRHQLPGWPGETAGYPCSAHTRSVFIFRTGASAGRTCRENCGASAQPDLGTIPPQPTCWEEPHAAGPLGGAVGASSWNPWPPAPPGGPRAASCQTRSREVPPGGRTADARRRTPRPVRTALKGDQLGGPWSQTRSPALLPWREGRGQELNTQPRQDSFPSCLQLKENAGRRSAQCKDISHSGRKCRLTRTHPWAPKAGREFSTTPGTEAAPTHLFRNRSHTVTSQDHTEGRPPAEHRAEKDAATQEIPAASSHSTALRL